MATEIGKYIRELRGKKSLRQMERETGVSHTYLSSIEKGKDPRSGSELIPPPETLKKIARGAGGSYPTMLSIAGYLPGDIIDEMEREQRKAYKEKAKHADIFDFKELDEVVEKLRKAVKYQKDVIRNDEKMNFHNAAYLKDLYLSLKETDPADFSKSELNKLREVIVLLLADSRNVDIDEIHKKVTESEKKNK